MRLAIISALVLSFAAAAPSVAHAQCDDLDRDSDGQSCRAGDCDDNDNAVYLGAPEICDGKDNNCDGMRDNPPDGDGDGANVCQGDCDDMNPNRRPGRMEVCDGVDNDCNPATLDSAITRSCYTGPPGTQGRGICRAGTEACSAPTGWSGMCVGQVLPAMEICDNIDQDCDGSNTNGAPDVDGDGSPSCLDCDDNNPMRTPGRMEVCDGIDNDCNPATLDATITRPCYTGPPNTEGRGICHGGTEACSGAGGWSGVCSGEQTPLAEVCDAADQDCDGNGFNGFANMDGDPVPACLGDCNDNDNTVYPGATEVCDTKDNDCDNMTDEAANGAPLQRGCYTGPAGTQNRGICRGGTELCNGPGWSGVCTGEVLPAAEMCDATDQDCDGSGFNGFPNVDNDPVPACAGDCDDNNPQRYPGNAEICDGIDNDCNGVIDDNFDRDGDGVTTCAGDCNDNNNQIFPGAPEACNGVDDDCDNMVDEDFPDMDMDGYRSCGPNPDCDDNDRERRPGLAETCDGKDNDCDTLVDERNAQGAPLQRGCYSGPMGTNGVGTCRAGQVSCINGTFSGNPCVGETVPRTEMCDRADDDCDGRTDEDFDADMDGVTSCSQPPDCDDNNPMIRPGAAEMCDGRDNDCDNRTDEDAMNNPLRRTCYTGPAGTQGVGVCRAGHNLCTAGGWDTMCTDQVVPAGMDACDMLDNDCDREVDEGFDQDGDGFSSCNGDCDDNNPAVHRGALEICNGVDDDCDGRTDGNMTPCYTGPTGTATVGNCRPGMAVCMNGQPGVCVGQRLPEMETCDNEDDDCDGDTDEDFDQDGDGVSSCGGDCADDNPFVNPRLPERCDCVDNDCNGRTDEDGMSSVCAYGACHDFDGDGFTNCEGDCNDRSAMVNPGAPEVCGDGVDSDCDGVIDEDVDEDGDNVTTCGGDCDDRFAAIHPGAVEACDAFDNDCNGMIDEGFDRDGDFATTCAGDCDDNDRNRNPFRREICGNGIDDDCDGVVDNDTDEDADGVTTCGGDCNDFNAAVHRGAQEICDGQDNDCNNMVDEGFDQDRDTFATCLGDCNDNDRAINPFAGERVDNVDNDCDGMIDEGADDRDGDGFSYLCGDCNDGDPSTSPQTMEICDARDNDCDGVIDRDPLGRSVCQSCNDVDGDGIADCDGDCNDQDPNVRPGGLEVCDGIDNDCNGSIDIDRVTGVNLCTSVDAGVPADGAAPVDTGSRSDAATDGGVSATGDASTSDAAPAGSGEPLKVECGCRAAGATGGARSSSAWAFLVLAGLFVLRLRFRFRRCCSATGALWALSALALAALALSSGCTRFEVGGAIEQDAGAGGDGGPGSDGGRSDGGGFDGSAFDFGVSDLGPIDTGPLTEGPCRLADPDQTSIIRHVPLGYALAVHRGIEVQPISGAAAVALDDEELQIRGFGLTATLPPTIDFRDPGAAGEVIDHLLDPMLHQGIPGVIGVATRVDETLRQAFIHDGRGAARTLRTITMRNAVSPARVRDGALAKMAQVPLAALGGLPPVPGESPSTVLTLAAYVDVSTSTNTASVVLALVPEVSTTSAATRLLDLTNASHIGAIGAEVDVGCKTSTASALLVDFLWVVDNSASMQEEQQALALAADTFFASLQRSRIDFRLGVVSTDGESLRGGSFTTDIETFRNNVRVGINGNGREQGLEYAVRAIERAATATDAEQRLRPDAVTVLVFYSDEESTNLRPLDAYITALRSHEVLAFAIVGPRPRGCQAIGRGSARVGESYIKVAEALGGTSASICAEDLTRPIQEILIAAAGAASEARLVEQPISGSLEVQLPMSLIPRGRTEGFDYDPGSNSILFFGAVTPPVGTPFRIAYKRFLEFRP